MTLGCQCSRLVVCDEPRHSPPRRIDGKRALAVGTAKQVLRIARWAELPGDGRVRIDQSSYCFERSVWPDGKGQGTRRFLQAAHLGTPFEFVDGEKAIGTH